MTLKEIAIELLEKYREAETSVIWEYSGNIQESIEILSKECESYKRLIEESE